MTYTLKDRLRDVELYEYGKVLRERAWVDRTIFCSCPEPLPLRTYMRQWRCICGCMIR